MSRAHTTARPWSRAAQRCAEVDAEIDEEFSLHLDLLERDLIDSGMDPAAARAAAAARFGDREKLRARCRRIALKEQLMLERINTVALVLVVAAMIFLAVRMEGSQSRHAAAVEAIAQRLQALPAPGATAADADPDRRVPAPPGPAIYFATGVARPGGYLLPQADTPLSLRDATSLAGGVVPSMAGGAVTVTRTDGTVTTASWEDFMARKGPEVRPGDLVQFTPGPEAAPAPEAGVVYVGPGVDRPGTYGLPAAGTMTLRRILIASGGLQRRDFSTITVVREDGPSQQLAVSALDDPGGEDITLKPGDRIEIR